VARTLAAGAMVAATLLFGTGVVASAAAANTFLPTHSAWSGGAFNGAGWAGAGWSGAGGAGAGWAGAGWA
jgi:hypothetical protein